MGDELTTGEKIKKLRTDKMMTQSELVGDQITRNMLSRIESDEANPSLSTLLYLAKRLNVPAGYLIADEDEDDVYSKAFVIRDIKRAYVSKNYRVCRQMCKDATFGDDELILIAAEATLAIAVEEFDKGCLYNALDYFDEAISYDGQSAYSTSHIKAAACMYMRYMRRFSPNLSSSVVDDDLIEHFCAMNNRFCRYIYALEGVESSHTTFARSYIEGGERDESTSLHLSAKIDMLNGNYRHAQTKLASVLYNQHETCRPLICAVMYDLEACCKAMGDFKGAYEYSCARVDLLQKMLSED